MRGISLFEKIPVNRTCKDALIPDNYCVCFEEKKINEIEFKEKYNLNFDNVVDFILDYVNNLTAYVRSICVPFKKSELKLVKTSSKNCFLFLVLFQPGDAWFESTVHIDIKKNNSLSILGKIIRASLYANQSNCVQDVVLKNYCYCKV